MSRIIGLSRKAFSDGMMRGMYQPVAGEARITICFRSPEIPTKQWRYHQVFVAGRRTAMPIISARGEMWPRNNDAINLIPTAKKGGRGIYILYDGSTPVYVGKGNIQWRIKDARRSERRGQSWDHFSWYRVLNKKHRHDIEALLLRMLPPYLRILNKQRGKLLKAKKYPYPKNKKSDPINRPHLF